MGFCVKGKGDGCHEAQCLEWGEHVSNAFLAFKILNLLEKVEGTSNAHGMGTSSLDAPISTLGIRDELPIKPEAPIITNTWELEIGPTLTRGEAHKMQQFL